MKRAGLLLLVMLLVAAGAWQWARPKTDVALPGPDATPAETVRAFVTALNARDFDTSNAILLAPDDAWHQGRWSRAPRLDDLELGKAIELRSTPDDGQSLSDDYAEAWHVQVTFDHSGGDGTMGDGPMPWGYSVVRDAPDERWRIVDQGMG